MYQYLFILFFLILVLSYNIKDHSLSFSGRRGKSVFVLCFVFFAIMAGFRSSKVGNDTMGYIEMFQQGDNMLYNGSRFELGFIYYNIFIQWFTKNVQLFFIITSIFIFSTYCLFIWKYSTRPKLALIFFFILSFGMTVNTIRQCLAICILLFSIESILQKRWLLFSIYVVSASLFHTTAIIFFLILPFSYLKINYKTISLFFVGSLVGYVLFAEIIKLGFSFFPMYEYYSDGKYFEGGTRVASIVQLFLSLIVFTLGYLPYRHTSGQWKDSLEGRRYALLLLLQLLAFFWLFLSLKVNLLDRLALYFSALSFVLISNAINLLPGHRRRIVTLFLLILFVSYSCIAMWLRPEWNRIFPIELEWNL